MIQRYKDRELAEGNTVDVYRNLHNNLFSIRDRKSGLVVAHGEGFKIHDAITKVSEAGRQRVIKEGRRNVHAYITGVYGGELEQEAIDEVYYQPFKQNCFTINGEPVTQLEAVLFTEGKAYKIWYS